MSERPILFSASMVRAILAGQKTITRRACQELPTAPGIHELVGGYGWNGNVQSPALVKYDDRGVSVWPFRASRYGGIGDSLWVREAWAAWFRDDVGGLHDWKDTGMAARVRENCSGIAYRATMGDGVSVKRWVTPLFMPRWASRITLDVVSVRVERLHDITDEEAIREGVRRVEDHHGEWYTGDPSKGAPAWASTPRDAFERLWVAINGRESWDRNEFVWRVEFARR